MAGMKVCCVSNAHADNLAASGACRCACWRAPLVCRLRVVLVDLVADGEWASFRMAVTEPPQDMARIPSNEMMRRLRGPLGLSRVDVGPPHHIQEILSGLALLAPVLRRHVVRPPQRILHKRQDHGQSELQRKTKGAHEGIYQAFLYKTYPFRTFKNPQLWAICLRVLKDLPLAGHITTHLIHELHSICSNQKHVKTEAHHEHHPHTQDKYRSPLIVLPYPTSYTAL